MIVPYEVAVDSDDRLLRLKAHTLGAVAGMMPIAVAGLVGFTRRGTIEDAVGFEADASLAGVLVPFLLEGPQHPTDPGVGVLRVDDLGSRAVPYRWHLRTHGLGDRITIYLRSADTLVAAIALGRSLTQPRFRNGEAVTLRRLQPLIERAYLRGVEPPSPMNGPRSREFDFSRGPRWSSSR